MEDLTEAENRIVNLIKEERYEEALIESRGLVLKHKNNTKVLGFLFELNFRIHHLMGDLEQAYHSHWVAGKIFLEAHDAAIKGKRETDHIQLANHIYSLRQGKL
ncbi:hypothetical protein POM88_018323 [Heracleum sosnowskyi]|uniref:Tetratricopeptide repeat protein n=1 Tax=Heracleum sosnowskyi TaxID=360622 RepID=A0AAD8IU66_9APIA|nr:hypothetical protein POM88_018323 [Heracleum sosnowskyi]